MTKLLGGWNVSPSHAPMDAFDYTMYGMVTNLEGLTTGTAAAPGWSPEKVTRPDSAPSQGKVLWTYGGGGCSPNSKPASEDEVSRIVSATINNGWDGVDFDDECRMNIPLVIETMRRLKENGKETSFGFIAGSDYNSPGTAQGKALTEKVRQVIDAGQCNRLIHYCYAAAMWSKADIENNVRQVLEKSLSYGMPAEKVILALTSRGLDDWSLNYFIEQVNNLNVGGIFIWAWEKLTPEHREILKKIK